MKKIFKEISFNQSKSSIQFDHVKLEDILKFKPTDHNQFQYHRVTFYVILLITQNQAKHNLNFKDYRLEKGSLITLRKDNIHKFYKSNAKGELLIFTEDFAVQHSNKLEASKLFLLFNEMLASPKIQLDKSSYDEIVLLIDLIKKEYSKVNDEYSPDIIRKFIQVIITKLFRVKSRENSIFASSKYLSTFLDFQALVEEHCFENKKVSFYANKIGITTKTLNNVTQSVIQKNAKAIINNIVIVQSKRLIINSQNSLSEISYQVGFDDPTNFFKYFAKYAGITPSQFRESFQAR